MKITLGNIAIIKLSEIDRAVFVENRDDTATVNVKLCTGKVHELTGDYETVFNTYSNFRQLLLLQRHAFIEYCNVIMNIKTIQGIQMNDSQTELKIIFGDKESITVKGAKGSTISDFRYFISKYAKASNVYRASMRRKQKLS